VDGAVIFIAGSKRRWQPIIVAMATYYFGYVSSLFLKIEMVVSRGDLSSRRPLLFLAGGRCGFSQRPLWFLAETVAVSRGDRCCFSQRPRSNRDNILPRKAMKEQR